MSAACGLILTKTLPLIGDDVGGRTPAACRASANGALARAVQDQPQAAVGTRGDRRLQADAHRPAGQHHHVARRRIKSDCKCFAGIYVSSPRRDKIPLLEADAGFPWNLVNAGEDVHLGRAGYGVLAERIATQVLSACPGGRCW